MPQIWMTYDEISDLLGCDAEVARAMAIHRSLDRRKSRDGLTRTKLDLDWTGRFIAAIREADPARDRAVRELRIMEDAMSRSGRPFEVRKTLLDGGAVAKGGGWLPPHSCFPSGPKNGCGPSKVPIGT
jgi:hypothetical protein